VDLKLRGPGDLMGTQQSGVLNLKIADIVKDNQILQSARYYAKKLLSEDQEMQLPKNKMVNYTYRQLSTSNHIWNYIS
jgi:ATP-dependent DNA helicase RecG